MMNPLYTVKYSLVFRKVLFQAHCSFLYTCYIWAILRVNMVLARIVILMKRVVWVSKA